ncbi:MAG: hypothetical protein U0939_01215 [Pirellulales bacterium]
MPPLTVERAWLGTTFKVGAHEPGTDAYKLEKAKQAYEKVADDPLVLAQLKSADMEQAFTNLKQTPPTNLTEYEQSLERLLDLRAKAHVVIDKKLKEIGDLFAQFKEARLCARNALAMRGDVSQSTDDFEKSLAAIETAEKTAIEKRDQREYQAAIDALNNGLIEFKKCENVIKLAKEDAQKETAKAKEQEQEAFKLYIGDSKQMRSMVGDPALMQLMVGSVVTEEMSQEKSQQLKIMEEALRGALDRYDKLKKTGLSPVDAADIALANIPRAFWPDRAIREIDMFYRVEQQIELDEAGQVANGIGEAFLTGAAVTDEYLDLAITTSADYMDYVLKIQLGFKAKDSIPKPGSKEFNKLNENQKSIITDNAQLIEIQQAFSITSKVTGGLGVGLKAIDAIVKIKNATGEFEGPVQQKTAEFERNKAIFDLLLGAKNVGADLLKDVFPPIGIIAKGVDVAKAAYDAAVYFKMLADINALGKKAERDPKSVVYLPLVRMAKHERLKAAEAVMRFVESALAVTGKSLELGGITAAGGLAIDATGKIIAQGSKFVFANIRWSDARKAKTAIAKAKGPPIDREMVAQVFKYSNRYATYCLAIAAIEDNDAWAIRYCTTTGLTEGEVSDPATSIMVLRKYILVKAQMDDEQQTFGDTIPGKVVGGAGQAIKWTGRKMDDLVRRRKTDAPYEPEFTVDEETGEQIANPKFVPLVHPKDVGELTRELWGKAKEKAIPAGWYDDRSGLGEELDYFQEILATWNTIGTLNDEEQEKQVAQNMWQCARGLYQFLMQLKPTTNDRKTPHEGMSQYLLAVQTIVQNFLNEVNVKRETLLKTVDDEKILNETYDKLKEKNKKAREQADKKLNALITDYKWDTPFGACRLAEYEALTISKLGVNPVLINGAINEATTGLHDEVLFPEARAHLGGYTDDQLDKPFKVMASSLLQKLVYRGLAEIALEARNLRDRPQPNAQPTTKTTKLPTTASLTVQDWKNAVKEAKNAGLQETKEAAAVEQTLTEYESELARFTTSGVGSYGANAQDRLRKLSEQLEAYDPVDQDNLPFPLMETFVSDLANLIPDQIEAIELSAVGGWKPQDADFTLEAKSWEKIKKTAVEKLMGDSSTGIGKALEKLGKAETALGKDASPENRLKCIQAIDELAEKIGKFKPETKSGKTHPGGVELKRLLINKATAKRSTLANDPTYKSSCEIKPSAIDAKQWENDKKTFIKHGLVDRATGIGKALKSYATAREKVDRDRASEKLQNAYYEAAKSLVSALDGCKPETTFKTPFEPALAYTKKLAEMVRAEMRDRLPWLKSL